MQIKSAEITDLESLTVLFGKYRRFYGKQNDVDAERSFLKERILKQDSEIFVVQEGTELLGFVQLYPLFSSTRLTKYWLLNDLFVDEDARGKGYSIQLIERAKQLCIDSNACGMYLETGKENLIGNKLYPKTGFKRMDSVNFYEWEV
jgi:GNAT superfamily N-acetyltransferase